MGYSLDEVRGKLIEKGLKITPQRIAILEAVYALKNHPTADNVIDYIRQSHPNVASGTVYKVLETLVKNDLIKKVTTDKDIMRYDGILDHHHHLYCTECDVIEDYVDEELNEILKNYFEKRDIKGFQINDFVLQIRGSFDNC